VTRIEVDAVQRDRPGWSARTDPDRADEIEHVVSDKATTTESGLPTQPTQQQINDAEWSNLDRWSGWYWDIYFSRHDSRWWVRRREPHLGWTYNAAHPRAMWYHYGSQLALLLIGLFVGLVLGLVAFR
jgi:hypothetical protein